MSLKTRNHIARRLMSLAAASILGLTLTTRPAFAADTALILGGTGLPTPPQSYVDAVGQLYLGPNGYGSYTPQVLTTPEQAYPITGANSLTGVSSLAQGTTIVTNAVSQQIAAGNHVVVFGYSQGAAVTGQSAVQLAASNNPPSPDQLSFVLVGDPNNPNGGLGTRFNLPGTSLPLLGEAFNAPSAAGSPYPTAAYIQEYDGFVDFPQYPLNVVSDLNAIVGIFTQHFGYADLTPQQISSAVQLPTTGGNTHYYMVRTPNLPLLDPVRLLPVIGNPLADLIQPDLAVIVNMGYGSVTNGWSPGPANVPTPIGLIPTNINLSDLVTALANGIPQGITNALNDLKSPQLFDFSSLSLLLSGLNTVGLTPSPTPSLLQLLNGFATLGNAGVPVTSTSTSVLANDLALGKPLADTLTALAVTLPQYDAQLFTSQLQAGNLVNAIGLPIAADVGLVPYSVLVGALLPIVGAVAGTVTQLAELTGLQPNPATATPAAATSAVTSSPASTAVTPAPVKPASTAKTTPAPAAPPTPTPPAVPKVTPALSTVTPAAAPAPVKTTPPAPAKVTPAVPDIVGAPAHRPVTTSSIVTPGSGGAHTPGGGTATGDSTHLHRTHG